MQALYSGQQAALPQDVQLESEATAGHEPCERQTLVALQMKPDGQAPLVEHFVLPLS
jgi:hypothetical protein